MKKPRKARVKIHYLSSDGLDLFGFSAPAISARGGRVHELQFQGGQRRVSFTSAEIEWL
jgi:hypothetical protein